MVPIPGKIANLPGTTVVPEVVEISLLLRSSQLKAVIELSRKHGQSVGELLRGLINDALRAEASVASPVEAAELTELGTFV